MKKPRLNIILVICLLGFVLAIILVAADEVFDIPYRIFNAPPTSINLHEVFIESVILLLIGGLTIFLIDRLELKRQTAEEQAVRLNKVLLLVRRINQLIVKLDDESELLKNACQQIITSKDYKFAWIGYSQESSYDILPVAQAGFEDGYLSSVNITWDDTEYGQAPSSIAIKTGCRCVANDLLSNPRYYPWRKEALKRGYKSEIALPIQVHHEVIGALVIYSEHPDDFDDDEVKLLIEMASDISLGIEKIRHREQLKQNEEHIYNLNEVLRALRNINQLITREKDRDQLIRKSCELMVETRGFCCAWILLFDEQKKYVSSAVAGDTDMSPFDEQLRQGNYPPCIERILQQEQLLAVCADIVEKEWVCLPRGYHNGGRGIISRLEYEGKVYGVISVYVPPDYIMEPDEQSLFNELADDIAYALDTIEKVEKHKRVEESVIVSETKYRRLFEAAKDGILIINPETGFIIDANPFITDILGLSKERVIGKELWEIGIFEDIAESKANFGELLHKEYIRYEDLPLRTADGRQIAVEFVSNIYEVDHQKIVQCNIRDINERKVAEEALKKSEEQLKKAQALGRIGSWEYDIAQKTITWSAETYVLYERDPELGPPSSEEEARYYSPEQAKALRNTAARAIETGQTFSYDLEATLPSGKTAYYHGVMQPVKDSHGQVIKLTGTVQDITERKKYEEQLRIAEQNFRNSLEDSPLGIRIITTDGELLYANKAILDIYGYVSFKEFKNIRAKERYTRESYAQFQKRRELRRMGKPTPSNYEVSIVRKDGGIRHLSVIRKEVRWNGEKHFQAIYQDITKRKQAEEMFRNLAMNSPVGVYIVQKGKFIYTNPQYQADTGYSEDELLGMDPLSLVVPEDREMVRDNAVRMLKGKPSAPYEFRIITKDGKVRWASEKVTSIKYEGKQATIGSYQDITERRQSEQSLRESEGKYRSLFENMHNGFAYCKIITDNHKKPVDFVYMEVNDAFEELTGLERKQIIGKRVTEAIPGTKELHPELFRICGKVALTGVPNEFEVYFKPLQIWLDVSLYSPQAGYFVAIFENVTERKKMQEHIILTDRLASIGELASGIAHEINNPLTGIIGLSEIVLDADVPADVREDLKTINSEAQRTARVVRNLLTFARKHPLNKQPTNINDAIAKVMELRAYEQKVNNINMVTHFAADLPEINGNSFQLQQVLINIIINAEHFMIEAHGGGTLTITTKQVDDIIRISIADDGTGIAQEVLPHIFDPFFTTKEVGKGTGLGLSICHGIVTEHGGRIYAESEIGRGTTFFIELPVTSVKDRETKSEKV